MPSGRALSSRWLGRVFSLNVERSAVPSELPLYLCPAFRSLSTSSAANTATRRRCHPPARPIQVRRLHSESAWSPSTEPPPLSRKPTKTLPLQCHGCGALAQTTVPDQAGYYDVSRKAIRQYLGLEEEKVNQRLLDADSVVQRALQSVDVDGLELQGINLRSLMPESKPRPAAASDKPPLCDRCHSLVHHTAGTSIYHPSIESLRDTIDETPYKKNHIYHVLDAADFPMSLLSGLHNLLDVNLRTQNRRSKLVKYRHGRQMDMSFVITRSDLLASQKEQVDGLMPYIKETLRDALGRVGGRIRLGNVHLVSSKRNWWTKDLKEDIWSRGGAGWMVGKANVGKSQLFEAVFPKGRMALEDPKGRISINVFPKARPAARDAEDAEDAEDPDPSNPFLPGRTAAPDADSTLLPPPRPETNFPEMPVVSSLPGTTASPIRVPFGSGRGELIDLPGLPRSDLEMHVQPSHRHSLIMKSRVVPEQQVLKPGQSLLLGGFVRLTPRNVAPDEELVFLAYAFTPLEPHLSSTEKAIAVQEQREDAPRVENISVEKTGSRIRHAGAFQIRYDVTKAKTGPLTRKVAVGLKVDRLPYRVLGIDILVEGCGWVEVVVQVRTRQLYAKEGGGATEPWAEAPMQSLDLRPEPVNAQKTRRGESEANWPVIDVYSPDGMFIGYREPMNAWELNKPRHNATKSRPRKSMKGVKKEVKRMSRERERANRA
ncbi:hypothetical protein C8A05DRAFT_30253 [Staphylotrichum tortipilum]|uniref:Genetic interactor of prohibitins 3, mitochondrial n=1 Tax=Staphylotrichum tortipilum TaxID=2831512 RepID=A0AAN6MST6_9PEZI|nr:hypothetical protein C8A05DRAFT_30253 [Staphylotrichum longicolle]